MRSMESLCPPIVEPHYVNRVLARCIIAYSCVAESGAETVTLGVCLREGLLFGSVGVEPRL